MPKPKTNKDVCVHHWIIEPPDGPTSMGRCKYCGTVKEFSNESYSLTDNTQVFSLNSAAYSRN